jgi:hypothetical protein
MTQINIPNYLWLHVHMFDYRTFDINEINDIYNSPLELIRDFEKIPGFVEHCDKIIKQNKKKNNNKTTYIMNVLYKSLSILFILSIYRTSSIKIY